MLLTTVRNSTKVNVNLLVAYPGTTVLCIWHWIGKNRCRTGERVLKQATVWISFIKISN